MLENLALKLSVQPESFIVTLYLLVGVLGALLSAAFNRSRGELSRAPYFVYSSLLYLAFGLTAQLWLASAIAMEGRFFWMLFLAQFTAAFVWGSIQAVLATARSRDIAGHGYLAILAPVPLANLYLLFARGQDVFSERRIDVPRLFSGGVGVLLGIVFLAVGVALTDNLPERVDRITERRASSAIGQERGLDLMLRTQGLAHTLSLVAKGIEVPMTFDDGRILIRIELTRDTLRYIYSVDAQNGASVEKWRGGLVAGNCNAPQLRQLFEAGATIEHVFLRRSDGYEDGRIVIDREACGL